MNRTTQAGQSGTDRWEKAKRRFVRAEGAARWEKHELSWAGNAERAAMDEWAQAQTVPDGVAQR